MSAAQNSARPFIRRVGTHRGAHLDEQVARFVFDEHGADKYDLPRGGPEWIYFLSDAEAQRFGKPDDFLLLGTGGGELDEHKLTGRLGGTCAAVLVAVDLGVDEKPEYQLLLREALRADTHKDPVTGEPSNPGPYELANLVKLLHRHSGKTDADVYEMCKYVFDALKRREAGEHPVRSQALLGRFGEHILYIPLAQRDVLTTGSRKADTKPLLRTIVVPEHADFATIVKALLVQRVGTHRRWRTEGRVTVQFVNSQHALNRFLDRDDVVFVGIEGGQYGPDKSVKATAKHLAVESIAGVRRFVEAADAFNASTARVFDLGSMVALLNSHGSLAARQVFNFVADAFEASRTQQAQMFEVCPAEFEAGLAAGTAAEYVHEGVKVCMVESDNAEMVGSLKVLRKADVVVIFGNASRSVFVSQRASDLLKPITILIAGEEARLARLDKQTCTQVFRDIEEMFAQGSGRELPGAPWWYAFLEGGGLLNGSTTHVADRLTQLTPRQLGQAVLFGVGAGVQKRQS